MSSRITRIIIPFYKRQDQLDRCREALKKAIDYCNPGCYESTFGEPLERFTTEVIDNSQNNIGFTKAVNQGLRNAMQHEPTEYAIILNQDCYLAENAIHAMIRFMDEHPKCAIASIKQVSSQDPDRIIHGGTLECYPTGQHEGGLVSKGDCAVSKKVPWANAACLIVRVKNIPEFGLMDENMFLIGSDSDWSYTARARGFEVWYIADAVCVHEHGVSSGSGEEWTQKQMYLDMLYFRSKWIGSDLYRELSMEIF